MDSSKGQEMQRYNSFSYNVNEGLLQSNVLDIAFDKNNFCWLAFANGIQKFDGKNFSTVPLQPGLPDDKWVNFFRCSNGDLLISHSQGVSKYEITGNRFIQVYNNRTGLKTPVFFIGEDEHIIYFYTPEGTITGIDDSTLKVITATKTGLPRNGFIPKPSDNIINHKVAFHVNSTLYLWDLQKRKLAGKPALIPHLFNFFLALKTENEVLYYNVKANMSLELYNFATDTVSVISVRQKDPIQTFRSIIYTWQNKTLISYYNNLYETDANFKEIKSELVNFQNQDIAGTVIARIKEDNFGNLYLVTISDGFKKIIRDNYPIKYYGTKKKEDNYVLSILPDKKNNRILAGTYGNGLLVFDTLQRVTHHIKTLPGKAYSFSSNSIIKNNNGEYIMFVCGEKNAWKLNNDFSKITPIKITASLPDNTNGVGYFSNFLFQNEQRAIIQSQGLLYKINFADNTVSEYEAMAANTMSGLFYNSSIITHTNDELIFYNGAAFTELKRIVFKSTGGVRCFATDKEQNIYVGSNKGIFKIDSAGKILRYWNKKSGLPDECIYAMVFDKDGLLWCSSNRGIFRLNQDSSIFQLTKEDGLQENEFNTNVVSMSQDGELYFGGINGVSSFLPAEINNEEEKIDLLFTSIKINNKESFTDTAVWNIEAIDLAHDQNSLSFDFIAMASNNPGQYIYQYKMEGVDKHWIQNNDLQTVRYFLPPGKYVFKLYASRLFNKDATAMKEISIIIHPPFWKTWWFLTALSLMLIGVLAYFINQYHRRGYQKKLVVLENEHNLRLERERISRDLHDNIGAYANAVLYNAELLEKEPETKLREALMSDLKFASKDIILSLRETIWALKKDSYTAEDCLLRIRNFIQPFNRYYQHIQFKIEGEAPAGKVLHYSRALNLVRMVQEAVTNAIKHAHATNIMIISKPVNGKWELHVTDNGNGFKDISNDTSDQGNGITNMKQRAIDAAFDLSIQSGQGTGTAIIIRI